MRRILRFVLGGLLFALALFTGSWIAYMPDAQERGAWRSETGGYVLYLTPMRAVLYSETSHSCLSVIAFPAHLKLVELAEGASIEADGQTLQLFVDGSLGPTTFLKLDDLPANCTDATPETATARDVFDATWTALNEHYAFFELHGVDWAARRALAPPHGGEGPVEDEDVTDMLLELTAGLDDGHLHFGTESIGYASPSVPPDWLPVDGTLSRETLYSIAFSNIGTELTRAEGAPIFYGLTADGIGYVAITHMDVAVPFGGNSKDTMAKVFEGVLSELSQAEALVIDIRYNPGGSDSVSFGIAGHFVDSPFQAFTKTTRDGDGQTDPLAGIVKPFDLTPFDGPVVVLTSKLTGSAAEIFTLAMREIDTVTTLGETTSGGLSDVMGFTLPNGWGLGLSNQTYFANDGKVYEAIGVPPDIAASFLASDFLAGEDKVLAAGLKVARDAILD